MKACQHSLRWWDMVGHAVLELGDDTHWLIRCLTRGQLKWVEAMSKGTWPVEKYNLPPMKRFAEER